MLRAFALVSVFALTAGAALAQPPADPNGYGAQPPAQQPYPPAAQGYPQGAGGNGGYGAPGYGQGGGGHWGGDPENRARRERMRAACATDISTYCTGADQDRTSLHQCMQSNQARFSQPCQSAIADMRAHHHDRGGPPPSDGQPGYGPPPQGVQQPPPQP